MILNEGTIPVLRFYNMHKVSTALIVHTTITTHLTLNVIYFQDVKGIKYVSWQEETLKTCFFLKTTRNIYFKAGKIHAFNQKTAIIGNISTNGRRYENCFKAGS
jgi:hypothetical protein